MVKALIIFSGGIGGVFAGMSLLYASIRITAAVTRRFFAEDEKEKK